jgi:hypothetical protein
MAWAFLSTCKEYSRNIGVQAYRGEMVAPAVCRRRAEYRPCLVLNKEDSMTPALLTPSLSCFPSTSLGFRYKEVRKQNLWPSAPRHKGRAFPPPPA